MRPTRCSVADMAAKLRTRGAAKTTMADEKERREREEEEC